MVDPIEIPRPLETYPSAADQSLAGELAARVRLEPFNAVATGVFVLAILHTFAAARVVALARRVQQRHDEHARLQGRASMPSVAAESLHFLGEVEVAFGLWAIVLLALATAYAGWEPAKHYFNDTVTYTEPLFVVVIMALSATRPVIGFAESALRRIASTAGATPGAWWVTILIVGPVLGSFITEPAAMTICALLLGRQFFDLEPSMRLKYATIGVLFVNISIGGTLTDFAAPPVLMVARPWNWDVWFVAGHFGWRAVIAIVTSTLVYYVLFRSEFRVLATRAPVADVEEPDEDASGPALSPVPAWLVAVHAAFIAWTVFNAHYPALFLGGFLLFLGVARATASCQTRLELKTPLLVGFFLAGLVIHGGLQGWWIAPVLGRLREVPLFFGATLLTAVNDNALITYLATLVPGLGERLRYAVVAGAVTGGGLTVIANAPNPAGQAILARHFEDGISPLGLLAGAFVPTLVASVAFLFF